MWKYAVLVTLAVIAFTEGCTYKKKECPDYVVVEKHPDYEVRQYPSLTWVTTTTENRSSILGEYTAFMRLFLYISGQNDREQKMAMTVPVRMRITEAENQTRTEMSFMVPSEFASNPPVPNDKTVTVAREDPTLYAVRTFKGYVMRQGQWVEESQKLAESVRNDETVVKDYYYQLGYNAPFELFDRRNEIWMVKKVEKETNQV